MLIFLLRITPMPQQRREVLEILRYVEGPTSALSGCLKCGLFEGAGEDPTILYLEQWDSLAAIQHHIQSPLFSKIISAIDMSINQPDIHFYEISQVRGLELVETLRRQEGIR